MDAIIKFAPLLLLCIIGVLLILKLILFPASTANKTINRFVYFKIQGVLNSNSVKSKKAKLLQNNLSTAILVIAIFDLLLFMMA